jgi:hypothetical protein
MNIYDVSEYIGIYDNIYRPESKDQIAFELKVEIEKVFRNVKHFIYRFEFFAINQKQCHN